MSKRAKDWADRWVRKRIPGAAPSTGAVLKELAKLASEKESRDAGGKPDLRRHGTVEHCWVRLDNLATRSGSSTPTTKRALEKLNDAALVLRRPRHDRHGWVVFNDYYLNVSDEPIEQFAARLELQWQRQGKRANREGEPEAQNELQETASLKLILDEPEAQNELASIRLNPEREPREREPLSKSSKKKRALPEGWTLPKPVRDRVHDRFVSKHKGTAIAEIIERSAESYRLDKGLIAMTDQERERSLLKWFERDKDLRLRSPGQVPRAANDDAAKRQLTEALEEVRRAEEADARERAQQSGGRRPGLSVNEQLVKLNQAVQEGTLAPLQSSEQQRRAGNHVA